jgi:hypothetical protein
MFEDAWPVPLRQLIGFRRVHAPKNDAHTVNLRCVAVDHAGVIELPPSVILLPDAATMIRGL